MKGLRPAGAAAILLLITAPAANAQDKSLNDRALRMIARSEAKHVRSRQNLIEILRDQPNFWIELQAIAKRLETEPAWLLNVMASESLFNPKARNGLPGQTATGLLQFIERHGAEHGNDHRSDQANESGRAIAPGREIPHAVSRSSQQPGRCLPGGLSRLHR